MRLDDIDLSAEATFTFDDPEVYERMLAAAAPPAMGLEFSATTYESEPRVAPLVRWADWRALPGRLVALVGYHYRQAMDRPRMHQEVRLHMAKVTYVGMECVGDRAVFTVNVVGQP